MSILSNTLKQNEVKLITPESIASGFINNLSKQTTRTTPQTIANSFLKGNALSKNLDTSAGLYNLAVNSGLQRQADVILKSQSGEDNKKIFSGGFISDIFDVLNAAQYGVVGVLKGKGFKEGVKTRQSFSDKDALGEFGLPGVVMGIILDIAVDPITYIAPYTILKKIPGVGKGVKAVEAAAFGKKVTKTIEGTAKTFEALEGGTKAGKFLAQKFAWMFGADPVFRQTYERGLKNTAIATKNVVDIIKPMSELSKETSAKLLDIDSTGRFFRKPLNTIKEILNPEEYKTVETIFNRLDDLGKEAVDLGLISKGKFEENFGKYIKNAYEEFDVNKVKSIFGSTKIGVKGIKARKAVKNVSEFGLTQIENPTYLMFKSMIDLTKDIENTKLLNNVFEKFGTDVAQEGFSKIPSSTKWGKLAGQYIPDHMKNYMSEIIIPSEKTIQKQIVANFKFFKVIMNPGTHARNIVSNKLLNYWKLGMNPLDPRVISSDIEAGKEIFKKGGKWIDEATPLGYNLDTFASNELKYLLDITDPSVLGKGAKGWNKIKRKLGDIYQGEENMAKLSAFIFNRKKGILSEEAWKLAESATFNYAQVTPFIRKVRESLFGVPFITFTVKSTPVVAETLLKAPQRISAIGKIKNSIENLANLEENQRERANEPSWVKNGFYVKLPMKDKNGRSAYFDLTYILPFGDLMAGNFLERNQDISTGLPESQAVSLMKKSPLIQVVSEIGKNKDFYGNSIWRSSDTSEKQLKDLMRHLTKTYLPPLVADQIPGGYNEAGEKQYRGIVGALGDKTGTTKRNLMEEMLRNVGAKIQPIDADIQETYAEWNKKKALESLLMQNGILNEYTKVYQPK